MDIRTKWLPGEMEDAHRIGLVFAKRPWPGFDEAVKEYRQIEADLIARPGIESWYLLELRRRIAEWIVQCASRDEVPFEQMQEAWNGLLVVGFSDIYAKQHMAWVYGDYCMYAERYDAGIAVVEAAVTEFAQWLQDAVLKPKERTFYEEHFDALTFLRDGLIALRAGGEEAAAWLARHEARQPSEQTLRGQDLGLELHKAMKPIADASSEHSFAEVERQYHQVETEFMSRLQDADEFFIPELKSRIAHAMFVAAHEHRQPFEVCRNLWNELRPWDFGHLEIKCPMIRRYAECCVFNHEPDAGLAVVEPLLAELQHQVDTDTADDMPSGKYPEEISCLQKLRNDLQALKTNS